MMLLKLSLHRRMKVMRLGVKASTSPPLSGEHQEYTMSPWGRIYPSILWTLVNHQQLQIVRSPVCRRAELSSSVHHNLCHPITSTPTTDQFLTAAWGWLYNFHQGKTSQWYHWMMKYGLKIQFQIDTCASLKHLMSHITSVPTLVHTDALPPGWTYYIEHHAMKKCLTMKLMDFSDISSDLPDIMMVMSDNDIPDLVDVLDVVCLHKHFLWLYLKK